MMRISGRLQPGWNYGPICECDAPVTTLVVKDCALDHHPVLALRPAPIATPTETPNASPR